jgi:ParB family transcriptional regulator, chromosome partitioning protein
MIESITIKHLSVSRANVRSHGRKEDLGPLKASIAAHGLLQCLVVIPQKKKGHYSVIAGGRRLTCLQQLIDEGVLAADMQVPVKILDEATDPSEASLAENFQRQAMNPADEAAAFALLISKGLHAQDVARRFGLTERHVKQRLRLANLAELVLDALRDGEISLDQAYAFAVSPDTKEQEQVFKQYRDQHWNMTPTNITKRLRNPTLPGNDRLCRYIGREAYLAAGGRIDEDLFSGDTVEDLWLDRALVEELAQAKLDAEAEQLASTAGVAWVKPVLTANVGWDDTQDFYQVRGTELPHTAEEEARIAELTTQLEAIDEAEDTDDWDASNDRYQALEKELGALSEPRYELTDEVKAQAGMFAFIDANGKVQLDPRYYSEQPTQGGTNGNTRSRNSKTGASGNAGLSESLAGALAKERSLVLQAAVCDHPAFAFNLAAFFMAEQAINRFVSGLGTSLRLSDGTRTFGGRTGEDALSAVAQNIADKRAALDTSWRSGSTVGERFKAFCELPEEVRTDWFAQMVAHTLDSSLHVPNGMRAIAFHDTLAQLLDIDLASQWRPTAETYFNRVSRTQLIDILTEIGGAQMSARFGSAKKAEIAKALEALCAGQSIVDADIRAKALAWVPVEMRFDAVETASEHLSDDNDDPSDIGDELDVCDVHGEANNMTTGTPQDTDDHSDQVIDDVDSTHPLADAA